jgi:hypothetical protein
MRLRLGGGNTSSEIASSTSPVYPGFPDSLNCIQTLGKTPILELPDKLLLMIRSFLDKKALLNSSRVCKRLHTVVGMCEVSTAWKHLASNPTAGETMELLGRLESKDSELLLVEGFRRYRPGTGQRETLKGFLASKENDSKLCTLLLRIDLQARLEQDAHFLLENGAGEEIWKKYKKFQKQNEERKRKSLEVRLQRAAAARTCGGTQLRTLSRPYESESIENALLVIFCSVLCGTAQHSEPLTEEMR